MPRSGHDGSSEKNYQQHLFSFSIRRAGPSADSQKKEVCLQKLTRQNVSHSQRNFKHLPRSSNWKPYCPGIINLLSMSSRIWFCCQSMASNIWEYIETLLQKLQLTSVSAGPQSFNCELCQRQKRGGWKPVSLISFGCFYWPNSQTAGPTTYHHQRWHSLH